MAPKYLCQGRHGFSNSHQGNLKVGGVSVLTMSFFTAIGIEDTVLLTIILIEVALLLVLLLIGLLNSTPATRSYISAFLVFAVLLFLFFQDQLYGISEPAIETIHTAQQRYS